MQSNAELNGWLCAGFIAWGLLNCFFGYRIFRVAILLYGALTGAIFGQAAGQAISADAWGEIGGIVIGALLGGTLAYLLFRVAIFIWGFLLGFGLGSLLLANYHPKIALLTGCVLGLVTGLAVLKLERVVLILATALIGALQALIGLMYFTQKTDWQYHVAHPDQLPALYASNTWLLPAALALATAGDFVQFGVRWPGSSSPKEKSKNKKK